LLDPDQRCRPTAAKSGSWHQDGFPTSKLPGSPLSFSTWLCSFSSCFPFEERGRQDEQITGNSMKAGVDIGLTARRLPPLAPQVSQVGKSAFVERKAVALPLDHAIGFELAYVGPGAVEVQRQCDAPTVAGLADRRPTGGRAMVTVSVIVFVPEH
jgi:hypothetical protein